VQDGLLKLKGARADALGDMSKFVTEAPGWARSADAEPGGFLEDRT
jgi:hypothetical protein